MTATIAKKHISVPRNEYARLKRLDKRFGEFLAYWDYLQSIHVAREDKRARKGVSQERLFRRLGL